MEASPLRHRHVLTFPSLKLACSSLPMLGRPGHVLPSKRDVIKPKRVNQYLRIDQQLS
jgi:hypothetical protein